MRQNDVEVSKSSIQLLQQFVSSGSQPVFEELVSSHVDLVYATALRVVNGNSGLAEDIAQTVFIDFARKASTLPNSTAPAAWLHRATRLEAIASLRAQARRHLREHTAVDLQTLHVMDQEPAWETIRPALDEAILELPETERLPLLHRFFGGKPFKDVGAELGISEEAARKRIHRSLERLRDILARRGIASTASALALVMEANAFVPAPAHLARQVVASLVRSSRFPLPHKLMKTLLISGAAVAVSAVATHLFDEQRLNRQRENEAGRVQATSAASSVDHPEVSPEELNRLRADHLELLRLRGLLANRSLSGPAGGEAVQEPERPRRTYQVFRGGFGGAVTNGQTVFFGGFLTHQMNRVFVYATPTIEMSPNLARLMVKVTSGVFTLNQEGLAKLDLTATFQETEGPIQAKCPSSVLAGCLDVANNAQFGKVTTFPPVWLSDRGTGRVGQYTPEDPYEIEISTDGPPTDDIIQIHVKPIIADRD